MRAERPLGAALSVDPADTARIVIDSDMMAVRDGLQSLFACELVRDLTEECRGTAEIVLAEALNNVVEHAYARYSGKIEVLMRRADSDLVFELIDAGLPMPGTEPPLGHLKEVLEIDDLPEGGFGWFLIRNLSHSLAYRRVGDRNRLTFCVSVNNLP
jgi:serine/threonine-protein kinase RsbW